ncbi:MAG: S8 family serine peptidase [Pseudonocardiaceae bacterium]
MRGVSRLLHLVMALLLVAAVSAVGAPAASARDQYWIEQLHLPLAWEQTRGAGVIVGLVDTGVDPTRPDLQGALLPQPTSSGIEGIPPMDEIGHGTSMARFIAGRGGGPDGVLGVAPEARVLSIDLPLLSGGLLMTDQNTKTVIDGGATVLNLSFGGVQPPSVGGGGDSLRYDEVLEYAEERDVVVVTSAGNVATQPDKLFAPATRPGVIAVSAIDATGAFRPDVSVQGPGVELAAPGVDMPGLHAPDSGPLSAGPAPLPRLTSGTSNSSAIVSGVAALVRAKYPELNAASVVQRLISTARDAGPPGHDPQYGHGIVDPVAALAADVAPVTENPLGSVIDPVVTTPPPVAQGPAESSAGQQIPLALVAGVLGGGAALIGAVVLVVVLVAQRRKSAPIRRYPPPGTWQ